MDRITTSLSGPKKFTNLRYAAVFIGTFVYSIFATHLQPKHAIALDGKRHFAVLQSGYHFHFVNN